jgi:hypothetical protein
MDRDEEMLQISIFVSTIQSVKMIPNPYLGGSAFCGRPDVDMIVSREQEQQVGAMAVSVCGPGSLSDDVRLAVRRRQTRSTIDFIEDAFTS